MNNIVFRASIPLILFALSSNVSAIGLGDLRGQSSLGENLRLEIDLLGLGKGSIGSNCFRLVPPAGAGDLPFLKQAALTVRQGKSPILEIRTEAPLREPILQLAVQVACGHEISREYVFMASPVKDAMPLPLPLPPPGDSVPISPVASVKRPTDVIAKPRQSATLAALPEPARLEPQRPRAGTRQPVVASQHRLILTNGDPVGEPSLQLVTELMPLRGVDSSEAQREILRLEFRMLIALHDQATTQLASAEKLRTMESTLGELQQRTAEFTERVEKGATISPPPLQDANAPGNSAGVVLKTAEPTVKPKLPSPPIQAEPEVDSGLSEWSLYGALLGALLGLGGWLAWRNYKVRQQGVGEIASQFGDSELIVDPKRGDEREDPIGLVMNDEPALKSSPTAVDLDVGQIDDEPPVLVEQSPKAQDSVFSISDTTVDEHFEANPVMELADIMLSFGRVKGAAQALQEYIDNNPQEALQPWIRLIEVYRMAGMRDEFEVMAHNLNQNFNVEIQHWDATESSVGRQSLDLVLDEAPHAPLPQCLEDMPRLMAMIVEMWSSSDVVGYLYQLLRDNRGGKRAGFSLPVVEEILFLVELKETANRFQ